MQRGLFDQIRMAHRAKIPQPAVGRNEDDALADDAGVVHVARTKLIASAVNEKQDRKFLVRHASRFPNVQEQTIFARAGGRDAAAKRLDLRTPGSKLASQADAVPLHRRLGLPPAEVAHRWRRIRDALEGDDVVFVIENALDQS